jgi:putative ABC transport system permease protein
MFRETLFLAFRNVKRRKTRSLLTILGIAVGIASVILFVSIGEGMKNAVVGSFGEVGNDLVVTPKFDPGRGEPLELTYDDLKEIEKIDGVEMALPRLSEFCTLEYGKYSQPTHIVGVDSYREKKVGVDVRDGRFLRESDKHRVVLGSKIQNITTYKRKDEKKSYRERKDNSTGGGNPFGSREDTIQIDVRRALTLRFETGGASTAKRFDVVGIMEEGGMPGGIFSQLDSAVVMPIETLREMTGAENEEVSQIVVRLEDPALAEEVSEEIQERAEVNVMSLKGILQSIASFFKVVEVLFFSIGSIALLVAGFGIMNTMLMAVLERTREIGVLKSIGATRAYIVRIFLMESALIGFFGGLLGALVGTLGSKSIDVVARFALRRFLHMPAENLAAMPSLTVVTPGLILFTITFAIFISMLFGLYPAVRASKLSPVEALRYF